MRVCSHGFSIERSLMVVDGHAPKTPNTCPDLEKKIRVCLYSKSFRFFRPGRDWYPRLTFLFRSVQRPLPPGEQVREAHASSSEDIRRILHLVLLNGLNSFATNRLYCARVRFADGKISYRVERTSGTREREILYPGIFLSASSPPELVGPHPSAVSRVRCIRRQSRLTLGSISSPPPAPAAPPPRLIMITETDVPMTSWSPAFPTCRKSFLFHEPSTHHSHTRWSYANVQCGRYPPIWNSHFDVCIQILIRKLTLHMGLDRPHPPSPPWHGEPFADSHDKKSFFDYRCLAIFLLTKQEG